MKNDEQKFEDYFSGKLTEEETRDFHLALEQDINLKNEYDYFLAIKEGTRLIERDNMRTELSGAKILVENTSEKSGFRLMSMLKWGAGIAAVLLVAFLTYTSMQPLDNDALYAQYYETYEVQAARGNTSDQLKEAYNKGDFAQFIPSALKAEESPELNMMLASAYMSSNKYPEAINTLTKISDETSLRDQKYWYLGLSYLKTGNLEQAKMQFNQLLSISNYKKIEIEQILSSISEKN